MIEALSWTSASLSFGDLILVKSTLLLGVVFFSSLALRRASASTQHYLWTLAFVALLTLPVASYLAVSSSSWRIPVPVLQSSTPSPAAAFDSGDTPPAPIRAREAPSSARRGGSAPFAWPSWWAAAWVGGSVLFVIRLIVGVTASRRAKRESRRLTDEAWLDLLGDAQARIGELSDVDLRITTTSPLPMTIGV